MINKVTVTNDYGESIVLDLCDPYSSGIAVREIQGLGPVNADISHSDYASKDGGSFNGARQGTRNIVFDLVFLDTNVSIEEVRHLTYKYWPNKRRIKILIETDTRSLVTEGVVESNEPSIWAEDFEGCQISVICDSSYLTSTNVQVSKLSSVVDSFRFPFTSLEDPELTFGYINVDRNVIVTNNGDVETGLIFEIIAYDEVVNPIIYNYRTQEWFGLNMTLHAGDVVQISTYTGAKTVYIIQDGVTYNAINYIMSKHPTFDTYLTWLKLAVGDQAFLIDYVDYGEGTKATLNIYHRNEYLGV